MFGVTQKDFAGSPIFAFKGKDGLTRFIPNDLGTVHEYIKASQEMNEQKQIKSGAI